LPVQTPQRSYLSDVIRIAVGIVALIVLGAGLYILFTGDPVGGSLVTAVGVGLAAMDLILGGVKQRRERRRPVLNDEVLDESRTFVDAFRRAQAAGVAVDVRLTNGEKLLKGVHDVKEREGIVSLYAPMTLDDRTTMREIRLDRIVSVSVTDVRWQS
jgi:hypothetical protein